ncbi:hypothetical protein Hdeb2414_s0044g00741861 [Helianthus debilis subsp. tardiflorus]
MSAEKHKISEEAEQERVASHKREKEYLQHIAMLEKVAEEKVAECEAFEILAEEMSADCKCLLARVVPLIAERIAGSEELAKYVYELGEVACDLGRKDGYAEGRAAAESKEPLKNFELYKTDHVSRYAEKRQEFESLEFGIWCLALDDEDHATGNAGASHQVSRMNDGVDRLCCVCYNVCSFLGFSHVYQSILSI